MAHLTETQRIEIFILIGCGDKTKTEQPGGWQFEHLILNFKYLVTQFLTCYCSL
jgi:hypothetical protein